MFFRRAPKVSHQSSKSDYPEKSDYFELSDQARDKLQRRVNMLPLQPSISVVIPAYKTPPYLLSALLNSVSNQIYKPVEIIVVDDSGPTGVIANSSEISVLRHPLVKIIHPGVNLGISDATNAGVAAAKGDFVAFVDHDDELTVDALISFAEKIAAEPEVDIWYSDQVTCDAKGETVHHFLKPDWSPIYFLG